jgi:hypothetical protein
MVKTLIRALIVGAFAVAVWQVGGGTGGHVHTTYAADLDCGDFNSQADAQDHYDADTSDPDNLDADHDGTACENYDYNGHDYCDHNYDCGNGCSFPYYNCTPDNYYGCDNPYYNGAPYTGAPVYYYGPPGNPYFNGAPVNPYNGQPNYNGNPYVYGYPYNNGYPYNGTPNQYNQCADGLNHSPGFNRPVAMTFLVGQTTIPCGAQTNLVARLVYPDGVGAPNRLVSFQSSLGTVYSNLLTDYSGYVQTTFVAPLSPAIVQIDATADGLRQTVQVKVDCPQPPLQAPPLGVTYVSPLISPPSTGDAGLAGGADGGTPWALIAAAVALLGAPVAAAAAVKVRR